MCSARVQMTLDEPIQSSTKSTQIQHHQSESMPTAPHMQYVIQSEVGGPVCDPVWGRWHAGPVCGERRWRRRVERRVFLGWRWRTTKLSQFELVCLRELFCQHHQPLQRIPRVILALWWETLMDSGSGSDDRQASNMAWPSSGPDQCWSSNMAWPSSGPDQCWSSQDLTLQQYDTSEWGW